MSNQVDSLRPTRRLLLDRLLLARISSGIGALALVMAVLLLVLQRDITAASLICTISALIGIGLWTVLAPNDFRTLISGRQALYGGNSIFTSVLVVGIVAIIYTLTANSGAAADLTTVGYYSLKPDVQKLVKDLDFSIQVTAFYNSARLNDQALDTPILRMFADAAPDKVRLVFVDPDEQPILAKNFGLVGSFGIYVSALDGKGQPDLNHTVQMRGDVAREAWIAEAILQLKARGRYKVLFTVGHNEIGTDLQKKEDAYAVRAGLENVGIMTGTVDLKNENIPADTTALVLLRPEHDLGQDEVAKLEQYTASGGKLLIMAKPAYRGQIQFMVTANSPMAKYLWATWGIRPQNDIVFDPKSYVEDPYRLLAAKVAQHPITNRDTTGSVPVRPLLTIAQSWELSSTLLQDVNLIPLILSSEQSIGKIDVRKVAANPANSANLQREAGDLAGPLVLAAAAENTRTNARLIVIGDSDWVYNDAITEFDGQYLWTNMMDWLTKYLTNITVSPTIKQLPLIVDTGSLNAVFIITLVVMPGLVLLAGGLVWWDRLRRT
jgi:ABC-type uncharacterized transport system